MKMMDFKMDEILSGFKTIHLPADVEGMRELSVRVIIDVINGFYLNTYASQTVMRDDISSVQIQQCIHIVWKTWFALQVLNSIIQKNNNLLFFSEEMVQIVNALQKALHSNIGAIMPHIANKTDFDNGVEVYGIQSINGLGLKSAFLGNIDQDGDGFIAKCFEVPQVYGYGDSKDEARASLERELSSIYTDLMEDDNFSSDLIELKSLLNEAVEK